MKCFYHPQTDGVAICGQCGKFCCRECVHEVGVTMLCEGCREQERNARLAQLHQVAAAETAQAEELRKHVSKRLMVSWVFAAAGGGIFLISGMSPNSDMPMPVYLSVPFGAYVMWSWYWGMVWFWPKWRNLVQRIRNALAGWLIIARPFTWFLMFVFYIAFYLSIPISIAAYYGVFGGGIYQYLKHRRIASARPAQALAKAV